MAFPTTLQDLDATRGTTGQTLANPNHITHHALEDSTIEALETKVGIDGSAVTTTHDYKLSGITGSDKSASLTGSEALTNKTLTSPKITVGSDAIGDLHYVSNSNGTQSRLAIGTATQQLRVNAGATALEYYTPAAQADASYAAKGVVEFLTDAATSGITVASGIANVNFGTSANQIVKLDGSAKIPAVDGSALTNVTVQGAGLANLSNTYGLDTSGTFTYQVGYPVASSSLISGWTVTLNSGTVGGGNGYGLINTTTNAGTHIVTGLPSFTASTTASALKWSLIGTKFISLKTRFFADTSAGAGDTSDLNFGIGLTTTGHGEYLYDTYNSSTHNRIVFLYSQSQQKLYSVTAKAGVGITVNEITGVTVGNANIYQIDISSASVKFYVNGVLKFTHTTNIPVDAEVAVMGLGLLSAGGASAYGNLSPVTITMPLTAS